MKSYKELDRSILEIDSISMNHNDTDYKLFNSILIIPVYHFSQTFFQNRECQYDFNPILLHA